MMRITVACLLGLLGGVSACSKPPNPDVVTGNGSNGGPGQAAPTVVLTTSEGKHTVSVEVVKSEQAIGQGLMYRQELAADAGMLFLMPETKVQTFWMRNTLISLDMIFIKEDMTVGGVVEHATPQTEDVRAIDVPTRYVLEVNGGWARRHGVARGDRVEFFHTSHAAR